MVYVIQKLVNGKWEDARDQHGQPYWFFTKREANAFIKTLGAWHRVVPVRD